MKILNLVLFSNDQYFDSMKEFTSVYYKSFPSVKTLYYKYTPSIEKDFLIEDDVLHIKGHESRIPGILLKTLKAFRYVVNTNEDFDYVLRTNISTVVNFDLLIKNISIYPSIYYDGILCKLKYITKDSGIDNKFQNMPYVSGLGILLSYDALKYIVYNDHLVDTNVIDDVAIGILFQTYRKDIKIRNICPQNNILFTPDTFTNIDMIQYCNNVIFYRNKSIDNRCLDVEKIKIITQYLIKTKSLL